ncbi:MAG: Ku protein [Geodermatophilaceae bacterium]|jgi:DNA end-binding protein Ku|nr:Ku protein [Geodermatophilaceae bacterium]MDQ3463908.1 Ku protein [Actinomycetota bacterium]
MPHSIWKGAISFGLVSIPVRLFSATEEKDVSFRQVHAADGGRIRYKRVCSVDGEEVPYSDIAKGYELPDGDMVVLEDEDFADLPISTSRAVDVLTFVPAEQLDPVQFGKAYYCEPTGDAKPYVLLRDALDNSEKVAVVKVALRNRERLATLRPRDGVLVLQTMLWPDEVREPSFSFLDQNVTIRSQEMTMAESYVEALAGDFEPDQYTDDYREALQEVIEAKSAGREVTRPAAPEVDDSKVLDLMDALRRSVDAAKQQRGAGAKATEPAEAKASEAKASPAKKAAAKKTAARKPAAAKAAAKRTAKATTKKPAAKKTASRKSA